jgi:hypothetical protein
MSRVTNAILVAHVGLPDGSDPEIESVNAFLKRTEGSGGGEFIQVTGHAGGYKHMECRVYLSAFNHAKTEVILQAVDQAPWRDRDVIQLFLKEQEEDLFTLRYSGPRNVEDTSGRAALGSLDSAIERALDDEKHGRTRQF